MKTIINLKKMIAGVMLTVGTHAIAQETIKPSIDSYSYKNALGLRAGETSGLTYKHIFGNSNAFEGILSAWPYTFGVTALYERYANLGVDGLNLYFGVGGHMNVGSPRYRYYYVYRGNEYVYVRNSNDVALGIDGIFGIEYKFKPIPLAISSDIKPYFENSLNSGYNYFTLDPSIGVKFTF